MKKLLLGTAIALALTTTSYAQTADYTYSWAHETYDSVKNAQCRTPQVEGAIFSLTNDIGSIENWIGHLDSLLQTISASDPAPLRQAAEKSRIQLNRAKFERDMMQVWVDNLQSKPACPPPAPPVTVNPQPPIDPPPIPQPAGTNCPAPRGHLRPILVATDSSGFMGVIWMDEQGNQYAATYNADGTSTWDGGGTAPARPSAAEVSKAGSLSSGGIFREYQERLPKKACRELLPQEPESLGKTQKVEQLHREINWPQPPVIDEWRVRLHGGREKSDSNSTRDNEKSDAKPSGNTEHSNGKWTHNRESAITKPETGSEHATRTVTHQPKEFHQVDHTGTGPMSGMHEGAMHEGAVVTSGLAGTRAGGLIGTHLGGLGGVHMGGRGGMRFGGFGRF
jgi:hypothetical protein